MLNTDFASMHAVLQSTIKFLHLLYRVSQTYLTFLNWLKMAVKCLPHVKSRLYYHHKDHPFNKKPYLMTSNSFPIVKINTKERNGFLSFEELLRR